MFSKLTLVLDDFGTIVVLVGVSSVVFGVIGALFEA